MSSTIINTILVGVRRQANTLILKMLFTEQANAEWAEKLNSTFDDKKPFKVTDRWKPSLHQRLLFPASVLLDF